MDKMLICILAQHSRSAAVVVHRECSLVWPDPLLCRTFVACSVSTQIRGSATQVALELATAIVD